MPRSRHPEVEAKRHLVIKEKPLKTMYFQCICNLYVGFNEGKSPDMGAPRCFRTRLCVRLAANSRARLGDLIRSGHLNGIHFNDLAQTCLL